MRTVNPICIASWSVFGLLRLSPISDVKILIQRYVMIAPGKLVYQKEQSRIYKEGRMKSVVPGYTQDVLTKLTGLLRIHQNDIIHAVTSYE